MEFYFDLSVVNWHNVLLLAGTFAFGFFSDLIKSGMVKSIKLLFKGLTYLNPAPIVVGLKNFVVNNFAAISLSTLLFFSVAGGTAALYNYHQKKENIKHSEVIKVKKGYLLIGADGTEYVSSDGIRWYNKSTFEKVEGEYSDLMTDQAERYKAKQHFVGE